MQYLHTLLFPILPRKMQQNQRKYRCELWLGNRGAMQERVSKFAADQAGMNDEVKRRFYMALQSRDETLPRHTPHNAQHPANAHLTLTLEFVSEAQDHNDTRTMCAIQTELRCLPATLRNCALAW